MKKRLAILLLALLVAGCGSQQRKALEENTAARNANTEAIKARNESNKSAADSENTLPEDDQPAGEKAPPEAPFLIVPCGIAQTPNRSAGRVASYFPRPLIPPIRKEHK